MSADAARQHLERLAAEPRPAGSPAEADARRYCTGFLEGFGFSIIEEPFDYSSAPGRWATSAGGAISIVVLATAAYLGRQGAAGAALITIGASLMVGGALALWVARHGVLDLPFGRARGVNLVATRGTPVPTVWLMAHLDSKSQPIPTAVRAAGIVTSAAAWLMAASIAVAQGLGASVSGWWTWMLILALAGGIPVAMSVVGAQSPGALDNASGVVTVLQAVARLATHARIGVVLTSAEELGLAGARAFARRHPKAIALNCDGVDDRGALICMRLARRPLRSVAALVSAASGAGVSMTVRGLLPGLLVDAVALHEAGWDSATLSRGDWSTLSRIHRPHDDLGHLTGSGIDDAARVLADAVQELSLTH